MGVVSLRPSHAELRKGPVNKNRTEVVEGCGQDGKGGSRTVVVSVSTLVCLLGVSVPFGTPVEEGDPEFSEMRGTRVVSGKVLHVFRVAQGRYDGDFE